jgi:YaaC-like Protein
VWHRLRALRHQPPGSAQDSAKRRNVFCAALEQAEQLFTAAAAVDYATRPILLFYGLSQAGRAVAAASTAAGEQEWKLAGHGIKATKLDQERLAHVQIRDAGKGAFTQLAPLLRSGSIPAGATLGEVWTAIPDLWRHPLSEATRPMPPLRLEGIRVFDDLFWASVCGLPWQFTDPYTEESLVEHLTGYPTLAGSAAPTAGPGQAFPHEDTQTADVVRTWPFPPERDLGAVERRLTQPYRGDDERWIFPALGGSSLPTRPLLTWWAVLHALSMLARYEPESWVRQLDVDRSPDAVSLEIALDRAIDVCPQLILHAINGVSA